MAELPAREDESLDEYLVRLSATRGLTAFLGVGAGPHDLSDPTGRGKRAHRKALAEIERHATAIAAALPRQSPAALRRQSPAALPHPWPPAVPGEPPPPSPRAD
ncbi:MAG: hypothetical protein GX868_15100 [Actinobacteria bacterium]|nr:hypothetical protein [Actinomycetota bacterium]